MGDYDTPRGITEPARETQVGIALNNLEKTCEELSQTVGRLENRLNHVRQERPEKSAGIGGAPIGGVPMAQRLGQSIDFVRNITNRLNSLERELEI